MIEAYWIIAGLIFICVNLLSAEWGFNGKVEYGIYFFIRFVRKKLNLK